MTTLHPNVDAQEISKFEELASRWWDPDSEFKPLHDLNPLRLDYIDQRVGGLAGKRALDIGCGGGILAESMAREGATVTGLDMGFEPLQVAKLHSLETGIPVDYVQETVEFDNLARSYKLFLASADADFGGGFLQFGISHLSGDGALPNKVVEAFLLRRSRDFVV